MRTETRLHGTASGHERLFAVVGDHNSLKKHVWRARIVLLTTDGYGKSEIMGQACVAKAAVWR